jgi:hypothetical protein
VWAGYGAGAQDKQSWTTHIQSRTGGAGGSIRVEGGTIKRTGEPVHPWVEREVWSSGRERSGGGGQVLGHWDVQVLFVFGIGTSSRAGDGQPCPGRGQCCAGCGSGWKLEFGVCVVAAEPGVRDKTHAFSQKTRQ